MPTFSSMSESKYLRKEDLDPERGNLLHIKGYKKVNVAQEGEEPEHRWIVEWNEQGFKPLVLNATNRAILAKVYGDDTDDSIDQPIVAYIDENVSFGGKIVGGVRLRAPKGKGVSKPKPPVEDPEDGGEIPFR